MKGPNRHVFHAGLQGTTPDFNRLMGAWQAISDARLREYRLALPLAWSDAGGVAEETLGYIASVRDNIEPALAEVVRVMK